MAENRDLLQAILDELKSSRRRGGQETTQRTPGTGGQATAGLSSEALAEKHAKEMEKLNETLKQAEKSYTNLEGISREYAQTRAQVNIALVEERQELERLVVQQREALEAENLSAETKERLSAALKSATEDLDKFKESQLEAAQAAEAATSAEENLAKEVSRLGQSVAGTGLQAGGFGDTMNNLSKKFKDVGATGGDMSTAITSGLKSFGKSALLKPLDMMVNSTIDLFKAQDAAISSFRRATGAGKEYNTEITSLERATYDAGVTAAQAGKTYQALYTGMSSFTQLNKSERQQISKTTALLETQGVSAGTTAKIMDQMTRSLGKSGGDANDVMLRLAGAADSLGVPMSQMADDFAASFGELAKYGDDAIGVFEGLAKQAKATGMEVGTLMKIAGQFDTFESAGQAVGKLNAILGGPYLNSIDMLNASEEERIELMRKTVDASGLQWEAMNRFEKQAIAKAMGVSVDEASRLMQMSTAEMELQAMQQEQLEERARNSQEMMEMLKNSFQALAMDLRPFFEETIIPWIEGFARMAKGFGEFMHKLGQFIKVGLMAAGIAALIAAPFTGGASILAYSALAGVVGGGIAFAMGGPETRGTGGGAAEEEAVDLEGFSLGGTVYGRNSKSRAVRINEGGAGETAILPVGTYVATANDTTKMIQGMAQLSAKTEETNSLLRSILENNGSGKKVQLVLDNGKEFSTTVVRQGLGGDVVSPFS